MTRLTLHCAHKRPCGRYFDFSRTVINFFSKKNYKHELRAQNLSSSYSRVFQRKKHFFPQIKKKKIQIRFNKIKFENSREYLSLSGTRLPLRASLKSLSPSKHNNTRLIISLCSCTYLHNGLYRSRNIYIYIYI